MYDVLSVQDIVGDRAADCLLCSQTFLIVFELYRGPGFAHLFELPAVLPGICPCTVARRVSNRVVGDRISVVCRQLVLPPAGAVSIRDAAIQIT